MKTIIKPITNLPVKNFLTGEELYISSLNYPFSESDIKQIISICNQPLIYEILFKKKLNSKPYQKKDAQKFQKWANKGWKDQTWFVFTIRNKQGDIVSCMDIKITPPKAEIGYWSNSKHPGIMTNAVIKMVDLAKKAKYKSLFARVLPTNYKSQNLLKRVGFKYSTRTMYEETLCFKYVLKF